MKKLTKQDLHDILLGAAIVGTGGGGSLKEGIELVDKAYDEGFEFTLAEINEIPDDALIASPYTCGSIGELSQEQKSKYDALPKIKEAKEVRAIKVLEEYFGNEFYGVIATELGGGNTAAALNVAARLGKPIVDADPAGRSVPCLQHSTLFLNDVSITPMGLANEFGDSMVITNVANDDRAELFARQTAVASFNSVGVVDHPGYWKNLKNALIKNTITYCLEIGRTARAAKEEGRNFAYDVAEKFNGYVVFEGEITEADWEDREGFTFGNLSISGEGEYSGQKLDIWFQNEYIMSWKNGEVFATAPDSINIYNRDEKMPLLNPNGKPGMKVTVFVLKAFEEWRTKEAVDIFGPRFFGYNMDYRRIEDII
ncbi:MULTISPECIES: DUF917 domain-containing protein [unclassified Sedimentibacter]|uniref:DUF917 domain-containing protein n=1 Tax=unclassified Sedimentibacter TaxID=2649220 RepID=UPI0027E164F9|nr:DUF917 domain-containing protein [Sedimentibacter sp. MB35-C1]WMJ76443.1 DUF917 domain-containing protein [Sedimentibacter sp. MB35-C1]